ncbi:alginate lyase family protein [Tenggerimyces flavus]|uniref:Alginate lyase family protein n=1 Tax=Tenggerimyces flavus TaxID=1708749 RepID=A0ABV7Y743_9ACTN|nr:alginate lyase family protein [Tenggerimyces flavus]MBM7785363.1 hypothetical protein [Tenggerimyces flavus]
MRRHRIIATLATAVAVLGATLAANPASAADSGFVHPGVLVSRPQLDHVRAKLAQGAEPWTTAYQAMTASTLASLDYQPKPRELVECGPYSTPNLGCSEERNDALAAYTHALNWYLTKDPRYADKAIAIMDAWARTIKGHTNHNAPLQTGWSGASWSRAGELIKHTYNGWAPQSLDRFATMLRTVYLPGITGANARPSYNGNWELIMTDAAIGIAVFLDDRQAFNDAVATWRGRVPAYIYLRSDGRLPKPPPNGGKEEEAALIKYWQNQTTFVDGLAQETCRDFGHTAWGFNAAAHVAETARIQGLDLYAEARERLVKAYEFHAKYDLGVPAESWLCNGTIKKGLGPNVEIAYNHYHNRLHIPMPRTGRLAQQLRPYGTSHFFGWETLTHASNP